MSVATTRMSRVGQIDRSVNITVQYSVLALLLMHDDIILCLRQSRDIIIMIL